MGQLLVTLVPVATAWMWMGRVAAGTLPERASLTIAAALAAPSVLFVLWRAVGLPLTYYPVFDATVWLALAGVAALVARREPPPLRLNGRALALMGAVVLTVLLITLPLIRRTVLEHPHGAWDAWAIWNLRAAFLAAPDPDWSRAFDPELAWSHTDYPLLLPAIVARVWVITSSTSTWGPIGISLLFGVGTVLAVVGSVSRHRGVLAASLALALLAVPEFVRQSVLQLADIPVGFFTVLALTLLATPTPTGPRLALAGAALGLAAWTKNEGLVAAFAAPLIYGGVVARQSGGPSALDRSVNVLIGLGPIVLLVAVFKILVAPENDVTSGLLRPGVFNYWLDIQRVAFVLRYMVTEAAAWGGWNTALGPAVLVVALCLAGRTGSIQAPAIVTAGLLLATQLTVFAVVYVMTPHSVAWHLQTSWSRLIAQLWPTAVWWACMRRSTWPLHPAREAG
jgi:hypothetical protein